MTPKLVKFVDFYSLNPVYINASSVQCVVGNEDKENPRCVVWVANQCFCVIGNSEAVIYDIEHALIK